MLKPVEMQEHHRAYVFEEAKRQKLDTMHGAWQNMAERHIVTAAQHILWLEQQLEEKNNEHQQA
jgi:hypothetical protein